MNRGLRFRLLNLLLAAAEVQLLALMIWFGSACADSGGGTTPGSLKGLLTIESPASASSVASIGPITGRLNSATTFDTIKLSLIRDSDGKAWNGSEWGGLGSTFLPVISDGDGAWRTAFDVAFPASLDPGYYLITAVADNLDSGELGGLQAYAYVTVGETTPPIKPVPYAWGYNGGGELGSGPGPDSNVLKKITTTGVLAGKNVCALAAGGEHKLALTTEGKVYAWGNNSVGQLGTGNFDWSNVPVAVNASGALAGKKIVAIGAGEYSSYAVDSDGKVYGWGSNNAGQLGDGTTTPRTTPVAVVASGALNGEIVTAVSGGADYTLARTVRGKVFAWGGNGSGQLGNGTNADSLVPVAVAGLSGKVIGQICAGNYHALVLTSAGQVYAFGDGFGGRLGNGSSSSSNLPVLVGQTSPMQGKEIVAVAAGINHSLALAAGGVVYAWGSNASFGLGDGSPQGNSSNLPVVVGGELTGKLVTRIATGWYTSHAFTADNRMYSWGDNTYSGLAGGSAIPTGSSVAVPTAVEDTGVLSPNKIVAGIAAGWDQASLLTMTRPGPIPDIAVEAKGANLSPNDEVDFDANVVGADGIVEFTIRNRGAGDLNNLSVSVGAGPFTVLSQPASSVLPSQSTTFTVSYDRAAEGVATGSITIFSSDPDRSVFPVALTGEAVSLGILSPDFNNPNVVGSIQAVAVQADGRILIGGDFTTVNGVPQPNLARLMPDGTPDTDFAPAVNAAVACIAVRPDGKIMIGGSFTLVNGMSRLRLARLNQSGATDIDFQADAVGGTVSALHIFPSDYSLLVAGSFSSVGGGPSFIAKLTYEGFLDPNFTPIVNGLVRCIAVQDDGFILIGGNFNTVGGQSRNHLARLEDDGFCDPDFIADTPGAVRCIAALPDGDVIVAGDFDQINSDFIPNIARLSSYGDVDDSFYADIDAPASIFSIAIQSNGSIAIGGAFDTIDGQTHDNLALIDQFGQLDANFTTSANDVVTGLLGLPDGQILVSGLYTNLGGVDRNSIGAVKLENAIQAFDTAFPHQVLWTVSGSFPETQDAILFTSTDNGANWTTIGPGVRIPAPSAGWQWFDNDIPPNGLLRIETTARGGMNSGSGSLHRIEHAFGSIPLLEVSLSGFPLPNGQTLDFGPTRLGSENFYDLTLTNVGGSPLVGIQDTQFEDGLQFDTIVLGDPTDFILDPAESITLRVRFAPRTLGDHLTYLVFNTNGQSGGVYSFVAKGIGTQPIDVWRDQNFQDPAGLGDGANDADEDGDDRGNLVEYAMGTDPNLPDLSGLSLSLDGSDIKFIYPRAKIALADVLYEVQWSDTLQTSDWHTDDIYENYLDENATIQWIVATIPQGEVGRRFVRLRITQIPID